MPRFYLAAVALLGSVAIPCSAVSTGRQDSGRWRFGETVTISESFPDVPHVEPHLAVNPSDPSNLIVAAAAFPTAGEPSRLFVYVSFDEGETWSRGEVASDSGEGVDAWTAFTRDGTAWLATLAPARVRRSTDGGRTWSEPRALPGPSLDYPKMAIDRTGGRFDGRVYLVGSQPVAPGVFALAVFRWRRRSQRFRPTQRIQPNDLNNQNGDLAVLNDGTLLATLHEIDHSGQFLVSPRLWAVRSVDGGRSFSAPHLVTEGYVADSPFLAVSPPDSPTPGRVFATWFGLEGRSAFFMATSDDGGRTWSQPRRLDAGQVDAPAHSPMIAVDPAGRLGVVWLEPRPEAGSGCFELLIRLSADGGRTLTAPRAVSEVTCSDTGRNGVGFGPDGTTISGRWESGGDYFGFAALPDGGFRVVWPHSSDGAFQLKTTVITPARESSG